MGRDAKPIDLLVLEGRKHLTKAEIEQRRKAQIKTGTSKLTCPEYVLKDPKALEKWQEIKKIYKDVDFVSSGDIGLLGRYCMTFSEYHEMLDSYQRIKEIHYDSSELDEFLNGTYMDEDEEKRYFSYKVKKQLRDMISIGAILSIEKAVNQKMDMLLKMEDRLFLSPLSKVKNVPKPKEKPQESKWDKFGAGQNG